jgi:amino acid transporter
MEGETGRNAGFLLPKYTEWHMLSQITAYPTQGLGMKKFGTFNGVFIPSFEAILGAVLFLILPLQVGTMGIIPMIIIIFISNIVTTTTAFSIGDCTSNLQDVGAGGMYAVSKRSLGKAFGGSIGIQLFLAQSASIGFYAIAFATPLASILSQFEWFQGISQFYFLSYQTPDQILGIAIALIGLIAGMVGADFIVKIQFIIFLILTLAIGSFYVAPFLGIEFAGQEIFTEAPNWFGDNWNLAFIGTLVAFFPAVTGIDAGVGMSGSLKDPRKSLSKGTFIAIGITFLVYVSLAVVFGLLRPELLVSSPGYEPEVTSIFSGNTPVYVLLIAGILFASGSSALSYFMTAPRTAQALTQDNILPGFLGFLGKDFTKKGNEPRWATLVTFAIVMVVLLNPEIEAIAAIVGIAFLVVYGWINLAAFFERISGNPSFRPTTKGHWAISLLGFLMSMGIIIAQDPLVGALIFASQLIIFLLILRFKSENKLEGVWWGLVFGFISWGLKRLNKIIQGTKNWRPMVGVFAFADSLEESAPALEIGDRISKLKGIALVNILTGKGISEAKQTKRSKDDQANSESSDQPELQGLPRSSLPGLKPWWCRTSNLASL